MTKTAAVAYEVRWRKTSNPSNQWSAPVPVSSDGHVTVPGLERLSDYTFEARAISGCGAKSAWATQTFTMPGPPAGTITLQELAGDVISNLDFDSGDLTTDRTNRTWIVRSQAITDPWGGTPTTAPLATQTNANEGYCMQIMPDQTFHPFRNDWNVDSRTDVTYELWNEDIDFCIEMFGRLNIGRQYNNTQQVLFALAFADAAFDDIGNEPDDWAFTCGVHDNDATNVALFAGISNGVVQANNAPIITSGAQTHIALSRQGDIASLWINGQLGYQWSNASQLFSNNYRNKGTDHLYFILGGNGKAGYNSSQWGWLGQIDNVRITSGWARYSAPFTVPSVPYKPLG